MTRLIKKPLDPSSMGVDTGTWAFLRTAGYCEYLKTAGDETGNVFGILPVEALLEYGNLNKKSGILPIGLWVNYRVGTADLDAAPTMTLIAESTRAQATPVATSLSLTAETLPTAQGSYEKYASCKGSEGLVPILFAGDILVVNLAFNTATTSVLGIRKFLLEYKEISMDC